MPIYEYRCGNCGHELEAIQKISDAPREECPECRRPALKRLISAPSFRLKGSGWYETDFKKGGQRNLHQADSASKGDSKSGSKSGSTGSGSGSSSKSSSSSSSTTKTD